MDIAARKNLFKQVRVAHRLLESYYKRIHQLIGDVTSDERLGLEFLAWEPTAFGRPCRSSTNILDRSEWSLLPGVMTHYLYIHGSKEKPQRLNDWMLDIHIVSDTAVDGMEEDTIMPSAEDANSMLYCYLIAPHKELNVDWYNGIWEAIEYTECTETPEPQCMEDDLQVYAAAFQIPLEELTEEGSVEVLVQKIIAYRDAVLPEKS